MKSITGSIHRLFPFLDFAAKVIKKHAPFLFAYYADMGRFPDNVLQMFESNVAKILILGLHKIQPAMIDKRHLPVIALNIYRIVTNKGFIDINII